MENSVLYLCWILKEALKTNVLNVAMAVLYKQRGVNRYRALVQGAVQCLEHQLRNATRSLGAFKTLIPL